MLQESFEQRSPLVGEFLALKLDNLLCSISLIAIHGTF